MSIASYLSALVEQKNNLADNLVSMGVSASTSETLNTLVPKVLDISGGGSGKDEEIIAGTISAYSNSSITAIRDYAFAKCASLSAVDFSAVTVIGSYAFSGCSSLLTISFPAATVIYQYAFNSCSKLKSVDFPEVTGIGANTFAKCSQLSTVSFPNAASIGNNAFAECSIKTASFPNAVTIGTSAFSLCRSLTTVYLDAVETIGSNAFNNCASLNNVHLTGGIVCSLVNSNAFSNTPIAGYLSRIGTIYVPASLIADYQIASNWSYYSSRFRSE